MIKSLLLALDRTQGALEAQRLGFELARKHGAELHGIAVVDPVAVAPAEPTPMGAATYKIHRDAVLIEKAAIDAEARAKSFADTCRAAQISARTSVSVGVPSDAIVKASAAHDAVLIGADSDFSGEPAASSSLVAALLLNNPRPLIVSPVSTAAEGPTCVAYDGSIPAMRALQLYCAMGLRRDAETVVVTAGDEAVATLATADEAVRFLTARGYKTRATPVSANGDVAGAIIAASAGAGMIVAGAYGHRGWRDWLLGSTTEALLRASPAHLFVHH